MTPHSSLVIAGLGSVGKAFLRLAGPYLNSFDAVFLVDRRESVLTPYDLPSAGHRVVIGDITEPSFVNRLMANLQQPALFINLCDGIDTVRLRRILSAYPVTYVDAGAGSGPTKNATFSEIMSYTNSACHNGHPHLVCQGINPGMVEIIARRIMREFPVHEQAFDVTVFEHDTLTASLPDGKIAVGWSPRDFVEEMMLLPAFEIRNGRATEPSTPGSLPVRFSLAGALLPFRIVAHEDIWNLSFIGRVQSARFLYGLSEKAMDTLAGNPEEVLKKLEVPGRNIPVFGRDSVAVIVRGITTSHVEGLVWSVDHHEIWHEYGINGVQYQTATSILFSLLLLSRDSFSIKTGTYNSATLPLDDEGWKTVELLFKELGIQWQPLNTEELPVEITPSTK